jgi:rRNA processing protein Krr1/Pno1
VLHNLLELKLERYQMEIRQQREDAIKKKQEEKERKMEEEAKEQLRIDREQRELELRYRMERGEINPDYSKIYKVNLLNKL